MSVRGLQVAGVVALTGWAGLLGRGFGAPARPTLPWSEAPVHLALASVGVALVARGRGARRARLVPAVATAGLASVAGLAVRNAASDARAFANAREAAMTRADLAPLDAYVDAGGARAAVASAEVRPRVELARLAEGSDEGALERFGATHPELGVEVAAARDRVRSRAFAEALGARRVARLRELAERFPDATDAPRARDAVAAAYAEGRAVLAASRGEGARAVAALLAASEAAPVPVRFRRHVAPSLATADGMLVRGLLGDDAGAPRAEASPFFDEVHAAAREASAVSALEQALSAGLPDGLVRLSLGPPLEAPRVVEPDRVAGVVRPVAPPGAGPSVLVDYEFAWSGKTFVGRESGRTYLGVRLHAFVVLVTSPSFEVEARVEPEPTLTVDYATWDGDADAGVQGAPESRVYDAMARRAFALLASRVREGASVTR